MTKKGQAEAPFSLLLAVAMMVMVIPIAVYLLTSFQGYECQTRIISNMESFAREVELSATLGGGERTVDIDLTSYACPDLQVDSFTIRRGGIDSCIEVCGDPNCFLLQAQYMSYFEIEAGEIVYSGPPVCIRIPVNVDLSTSLATCTQYGAQALVESGLTINDGFTDLIEPGVHRIKLIKTSRDPVTHSVTSPTLALCEVQR